MNGIFTGLGAPKVSTNAFDRNLHRNFLKMVDGRINGASASQTDLRPLLKAALKNVAVQLVSAQGRAADKVTKAHLAETLNDVTKILADTYSKGASSAPTAIVGGPVGRNAVQVRSRPQARTRLLVSDGSC